MAMKRNMYSMFHQVATMGRLGMMTPFLRLEVAPGDTWSGRVGMLLRFSPLKRALLQDLYVDQYVFYVPWRLVWDEWEDFIASGPNPASPAPVPPTSMVNDPALFNIGGVAGHNNLYRRAYNLCYNEFFRDELSAPLPADDVPFSASVRPGEAGNMYIAPKRHWINELRDSSATGIPAQIDVRLSTTGAVWPGLAVPGTSVMVQADDVLRAIAQQKLQMKRATYGTRYIDILRSYGVRVRHDMLQLPEIVSTAHGSVNITDVVSTSNAAGELGELAGHAINGSRIQIRRKTFSEHGCLIGFVCVRPPFVDKDLKDWMDSPTSYQDYYDPALELLPDQVYDMSRMLPSAVPGTEFHGPWGQWYRGALNRTHTGLGTWTLDHFGGLAFAADDLRVSAVYQDDADALFNDVTYGHYQVSAVNGLKALRMIKRGNPAIRTGST